MINLKTLTLYDFLSLEDYCEPSIEYLTSEPTIDTRLTEYSKIYDMYITPHLKEYDIITNDNNLYLTDNLTLHYKTLRVIIDNIKELRKAISEDILLTVSDNIRHHLYRDEPKHIVWIFEEKKEYAHNNHIEFVFNRFVKAQTKIEKAISQCKGTLDISTKVRIQVHLFIELLFLYYDILYNGLLYISDNNSTDLYVPSNDTIAWIKINNIIPKNNDLDNWITELSYFNDKYKYRKLFEINKDDIFNSYL